MTEDPRQAAYDAVLQYIRDNRQSASGNAHAWRCVYVALNALGIGTPVDPVTGQPMPGGPS